MRVSLLKPGAYLSESYTLNCTPSLPLGSQTLTHGLLQCHELREADAFFTRRVRHRLTQAPQAGEGLTPQRVLDGLYQLLLHPIEWLQRPLIIEQAPHLAPLWPRE